MTRTIYESMPWGRLTMEIGDSRVLVTVWSSETTTSLDLVLWCETREDQTSLFDALSHVTGVSEKREAK